MALIRVWIAISLSLILVSASRATYADTPGERENPTAAAYLEQMMDHKEAPIKSKADLAAHLAQGNSPIDALSAAGRQLFLDSLVFGEGGLGSFRRVELEAELTPTQIYEILKLFGFQRAITGFSNARIETQHDVTLLAGPDGVSAQSDPCAGYVHGRCGGRGWCRRNDSDCCHPPSCEAAESEQ